MTQKFDALEYLPEDEYAELIETLRVFSTLILFEFARRPIQVRDRIIRNFIARGASTLDGIHRLWTEHYFADCWALFRTLVDRLFHLHALAERDEFELFEEWSFIRQFEANNRALSHQEFGPRLNRSLAEPTPEQKTRYKALKSKKPVWFRPKPEETARSLNLPFLYPFAYDFASTHVHPMANDGEHEFHLLTRLEPTGPKIDHRVILHDTVLVFTLLLQHALNSSTLRWRRLIFDFVDAARAALSGDSRAYRVAFVKIGSAGPDIDWSDNGSPGARNLTEADQADGASGDA